MISSVLGAEEYSFDAYLSDRGGCSAHRQILDERLKELRFNFVSPGKSNRGQGIDLFGRVAAEWTERDIQGVLVAFRRCEERILRGSLDRPGRQNREAMLKEYEILIARGASRIEETLREIIAADRSGTARDGAEASREARLKRGDAPADRLNRGGAQPSATEMEQELARTRGPADRSDQADPERARRAEVQAELLQEARRVARDRERDRMRAEMSPGGRQPAQAAPDRAGEASSAKAFAYAPRPILDRSNCTVTREGFNQVQRGMPLDRVEAVIGCRGTLTTTTISADLGKVEVHQWDDKKTNSTITVQFLNGLVYTKSQMGLN